MATHADAVSINADGSMTIVINEFMNEAQAASFAGAAVASSVAVTGPCVTMTFTLTPAVPITEPKSVVDIGGTFGAD